MLERTLMHPSSGSRTPRQPAIALLIGILAIVTAVFGLPTTASAGTLSASPGGNTSGGATSTHPAAPKQTTVTATCASGRQGFATCFALRRDDIAGKRGLQPADTVPDGYGAGDLRGAYALPTDGGAGAIVAIVDAFDDPNAEADLAVYRQQFGLPPCTTANGCLRKVDQRGGADYPPTDAGWAGEISLDLDMVSAVAPAAHIILVEADDNFNDNLAASVDEAVALGATYVSNSYGSAYSSTPGSGESASDVTDLDPHYNHPGVAVVASSGDDDFGVSYPASSQYVTAVGGTSLVTAGTPRGWSESVWHNSDGGPGSGCSIIEAKPAWQTDTGCAKRTEADVSAVADPETGVAVYQTFGFTGWAVYGGTSASAPIIAGVFADAGQPVAGTYPSSYPYANPAGLNDVTAGNNGTCSPAYLCTAGAGYDGPTGLGTPHGVAAFTTGPHGELSGTVTDAGTGAPIAGATVTAGTAVGLTNTAGGYDIAVPVGTYDVTVAAYGYASGTASGVSIVDGSHVTQNFALAAVPRSTISGTVTDGSGHNWPLYARITVDGVPGGPVYTDPNTGHYSLSLPQGQLYQLHVTPVYSGYTTRAASVALGTTDAVANVAVPVDAASCTAPGYTVHFAGATEPFTATTAPPGWTVDNGTGTGGWQFTDDGHRGNLTGGSGGFAIVDSDHLGVGVSQNTTLTAPPADFTGSLNPSISFDNDYRGFPGQTGTVELSVDSGATWTPLWSHAADSVRGPSHVDLPAPSAAGKAGVLIRFRFTSSFGWWWELDNVFVGTRTCDPVSGGLVVGLVTDANTHGAVNGAVITSTDFPAVSATSSATPDDVNLADGFYWLFAPGGKHPFTATRAHYLALTKTVNVAVDFVTPANFNLKAGQITVTPTSIDKTVAWAKTATQNLTIKNTGSAPATVDLSEQPGGFQLLAKGGAPLHKVAGTFSKHALAAALAKPGLAKPQAAAPDATPADAPWTSIADYPTTIQDSTAAVNGGKVYSGFGFNGTADTSTFNVYDPGTGAWTALASAGDTREKPAAGFLGGKFYAVGGWGGNGDPDPAMEIFDPSTNSWTIGTSSPKPYAASGTAILNNKLYVIGGCTADVCGNTDVEVYDPAADSWTAAAAYPESDAWVACGALTGGIYCAGGTTDAGSTKHTYQYDPGTNSWSPRADMPIDLWGSATVAANGMLLVSGGVTDNGASITNQGYAYDPVTDAWAALPNANQSVYRGASACGFYQIGGSPGGLFVPPVASAEVLPGFVDCDANADVPWLSESATTAVLAPGASVKITVTLDASVAAITQPGTYTAALLVSSETPYPVTPVNVTMTVNPPKTWGKITGTVSSASGGAPIPGATVQINTWATSYTLKTDPSGHYALWLDVRNNPLQLIVAKDGFQPQTTQVKIAKGTTTTASFSLKKD
jgi:N-acetylneuraminic acid mutarotase